MSKKCQTVSIFIDSVIFYLNELFPVYKFAVFGYFLSRNSEGKISSGFFIAQEGKLKRCKICAEAVNAKRKYCSNTCKSKARMAKDVFPYPAPQSEHEAKISGQRLYQGKNCNKCEQNWKMIGTHSCLTCTRQKQFEKASARMKEVNAEKRETKLNLGYRLPTKEMRNHLCARVNLNYAGDNCYGDLMH